MCEHTLRSTHFHVTLNFFRSNGKFVWTSLEPVVRDERLPWLPYNSLCGEIMISDLFYCNRVRCVRVQTVDCMHAVYKFCVTSQARMQCHVFVLRQNGRCLINGGQNLRHA
jgi:hypothetical protein